MEKDEHMPICDACGQQNREQARFCGDCGQPLQAVILEPSEEVTKPVADKEERFATEAYTKAEAEPPAREVIARNKQEKEIPALQGLKQWSRQDWYQVLSWGFGLLFGIAGLGAVGNGTILTALVMWALALVLLPPGWVFIREKTGRPLSPWARTLVIISLVPLLGMLSDHNEQRKAQVALQEARQAGFSSLSEYNEAQSLGIAEKAKYDEYKQEQAKRAAEEARYAAEIKAAGEEIGRAAGKAPGDPQSAITEHLMRVLNDPESLKLNDCSPPVLYFPHLTESSRAVLKSLDTTAQIQRIYRETYPAAALHPLPDTPGWFMMCTFHARNVFGGMIGAGGAFLIANHEVIWWNRIE